MKVAAILGSPSLRVLSVSVAATEATLNFVDLRARELCESRGGRPGLPVPQSSFGLCGCKATLNLNFKLLI